MHFVALIRIIQVGGGEGSVDRIFSFVLSGYITVDELREVLNRLNHNVSDNRIADVLREIDTDQDGKISYEEFVQMLQRA